MISIAFFNNKGGVGKTTLIYHLAYMIAESQRVLLVDLDPQSNLTAMCLTEERLEEIWPATSDHPSSILGSIRPLLEGTGDIAEPPVELVTGNLGLVPGDLGLSTFEEKLSESWPRAAGRDESALRVLSTFHRLATRAAVKHRAEIVLFDLGPNLGAINRAALIASDRVVTPLAPDPFFIQGLRNLGPVMADWREGWRGCLALKRAPDLVLPRGSMSPIGYVVIQAAMRLSHPVRAYERWLKRIPSQYHESILRDSLRPETTALDPECLGVMRNYQSLVPLSQDARKPMFQLRPADGAIGSQADAVRRCREEFQKLANAVLERLKGEGAGD